MRELSVIRQYRRVAHFTADPKRGVDGVYRTLCGREVEDVSFMGFFEGNDAVARSCQPGQQGVCVKCASIAPKQMRIRFLNRVIRNNRASIHVLQAQIHELQQLNKKWFAERDELKKGQS